MGATPFQVEAWTEYGIGLLVLFARIIYRSITLGKHWEGDDYFAVVSVFFWTVSRIVVGDLDIARQELTESRRSFACSS